MHPLHPAARLRPAATKPPAVPSGHLDPPPAAGAATRGLCALAAVGAGSLVCAALAGLFDSVGSQPWLADTPAHRRQLAHCDAHRGPLARQRCVQQVIAELRQPEARRRLARGEPDVRSLQDDGR